jgi:phosphotransferase system enzyme I (PtsI)
MISPADTTQMRLDNVLGFVTDMGGKTSHRYYCPVLEIPAVVGLGDHPGLAAGWLIMDGAMGR